MRRSADPSASPMRDDVARLVDRAAFPDPGILHDGPRLELGDPLFGSVESGITLLVPRVHLLRELGQILKPMKHHAERAHRNRSISDTRAVLLGGFPVAILEVVGIDGDARRVTARRQ